MGSEIGGYTMRYLFALMLFLFCSSVQAGQKVIGTLYVTGNAGIGVETPTTTLDVLGYTSTTDLRTIDERGSIGLYTDSSAMFVAVGSDLEPETNIFALQSTDPSDGDSWRLSFRGRSARSSTDIQLFNRTFSLDAYGLLIDKQPAATPLIGLYSMGRGGFEEGGAPGFTGVEAGTFLAINSSDGSTADFANWQVNGSSKFRVASNGDTYSSGAIRSSSDANLPSYFMSNVGVGIVEPLAKLHILTDGVPLIVSGGGTQSGTARFQSTLNTGYAGANLYNESGTLSASFAYGNTSASAFTNEFVFASRQTTIPLKFYQGGTSAARERIRIDASSNVSILNSNVGIGTSEPPSKLCVMGTAATSSYTTACFRNSANSIAMAIKGNGNVGIGTSEPVTLLDVKGYTRIGNSIDSPAKTLTVTGHLNFDRVTNVTSAQMSAVTLTNAGAGSIPAGQYYYMVCFVTAEGVTGNINIYAGAPTIALLSPSKVAISNIPTSSDPRVTARKIYRSQTGQVGDYYFLYAIATINDNTTTTYTDNTTSYDSTDWTYNKINTTAGIQYFDNSTSVSRIGDYLTAYGYNALGSITRGSTTAAFGSGALVNCTTGDSNQAFGHAAQSSVTTGGNNVAMGYAALQGNQTGSGNTCVGHNSCRNTTTSSIAGNTAIGIESGGGMAASNNYNLSAGYYAGGGSQATGGIYLGFRAGYRAAGLGAVGNYQIAIGTDTGRALGTGLRNVLFGYGVELANPNTNDQLNIGNVIYATGTASGSAPSATGNVGIGTYAPRQKLEVAGSIIASNNVGVGTTSFATYDAIVAKGTVDNYWQLNIQNKSTGTSASSDVVATADNGSETSNYIDMGINGSGYTGGVFGAANDAYLYSMNTNKNLYVGIGTTGGNIVFVNGGTNVSTNEKVRIDSNGNVGIGTTAPQQKLQVTGTAQMTGFKLTTSPSAGYVLTSDSVGVGTWQPATGGSSQWTGTTAIYFDGNVGIGTSTTSSKLNVAVRDTNFSSVEYPLNVTHAAVTTAGFTVNTDATLTTNFISYFDLDESSGSTAYDSYASNDGTITGATSTASGKISRALDFESSSASQYVSIGTTGIPSGSNPVSVSLWWKPESTGVKSMLFGYGTNAANDYKTFAVVQWNTDNKLRIFYNGTNSSASSTALVAGNWYHVVAIDNGTNVKIFLNGSSVLNEARYAGSNKTPTTVLIGGMTASLAGGEGIRCDGIVDEVAIWSKELSAQEIADLYNSGSGNTYTDATNTIGAGIKINNSNTAGSLITTASMASSFTDDTVGSEDTTFTLSTMSNGSLSPSIFIDANKNIGIGTALPQALLTVGSSGQFQVSSSGAVTQSGGNAGRATCWKTATTLSYCTSVVAADGSCTCN